MIYSATFLKKKYKENSIICSYILTQLCYLSSKWQRIHQKHFDILSKSDFVHFARRFVSNLKMSYWYIATCTKISSLEALGIDFFHWNIVS
jgi:hypothetical protein